MGDELTSKDLRHLATWCPPPPHPASVRREALAHPAQITPASHRELIQTYGVGCFGEFVWVFADGAPNSNLDITDSTYQLRSILREKTPNHLSRVLEEHRSTSDHLVQWGVTDNADVLAWIAVGEPERWPTVIIQAGQLDAVVSPVSSTATVLHLLTGSLHIPFFPSDFPSERPEFSANPYE
ncbi:hypothetical protein GCM10010270_33370 [Streptomyces violaceus]|nr:hypothetical protein GCM10010270_33370 [Streptomyces janthinus]